MTGWLDVLPGGALVPSGTALWGRVAACDGCAWRVAVCDRCLSRDMRAGSWPTCPLCGSELVVASPRQDDDPETCVTCGEPVAVLR